MKKTLTTFGIMIVIILFFSVNAWAETHQKIYDFAELLSADEVEQLEGIATSYSNEQAVDIIVLTKDRADGRDIERYMGDFYDEMGLGYNQSHGDTVMLTIDIVERDVYVAGFYKGETYIHNQRADMIREEITPYLSDGNFFEAFKNYIELTAHYLAIEPEPTPGGQTSGGQTPYVGTPTETYYHTKEENIFFELWFQLLVSVVVAGVVVGIMGYHSSGRKTTNARTYLDEGNSALTARNDRFIRKTVTKVKKPSSNNKGIGGGGGFTGGGHSHSGSKGKF